MASGNRREVAAVVEVKEAGPVSVEVEIEVGPVDRIIESARRQIETTRAAGCYTLPADPSNLPARNPRLPQEK